jgi:signal transduction histidine kinase/tetratricopeptide (TPR) repeat protein
LSKIIPIKSNLAINYIIFAQQNYPMKIKSLTILCYNFLLLIFLCNLSINAQSELDSLLSIDFSKLTPKKRVETLINTSRAYYVEYELEKGVEYGKKAIEGAYKLQNDTLVGQAEFFTALNFHEINVDSAIIYTQKSYKKLKKYNHPWFIFALDNLSLYYIQKSMYPEALEYSLEELAYYKNLNDSANIVDASIDVGYLYDRIGDYKTALEWHHKTLNEAKKIKNEYLIIKVNGFIGIVYDELQLYDSAHYYNQIALQGYKKFEEMDRYRTWCSNIANTYSKQKNWPEAIKYLTLSLENEDYTLPSNAIKLINLGKTYTELKEFDKAEKYLDLGIENCIFHKQILYLSEGYFHKSTLYTAKSDFKGALENYKLYKAYQDTAFNEQKSNQIAYMQVKFETEEKEKLLLEEQHKKQVAENENLQLDIKLTSRNNLLLASGGALLLVFFGGFYWIQRNRKKLTAEKNKAIIEEKDRGLKAVINAQEEERSRVARELHDGIVQELTVIKNQLQGAVSLTSGDTKILLEKLTNDLQASSKEVRNISHQLMPLALKELGIVAAMQDMLDKVLSPLNIKYDFEEIGMEERLPEKIEVSLYRIAQELTNNIIKHSGANQVTLTLNNRGGFITMIVEDNGHGFKTDTKSDGIGLTNISSRINLVHGELKYESNEETGTVTIVRIPLKEVVS